MSAPMLDTAEALLERWLTRVAAGPSTLALDYDGTLAPFHAERMHAHIPDATAEILQAIHETRHCRLVIVSGRPVEELRVLVPLRPLPELWGAHGWERWTPDGEAGSYAVPLAIDAALDAEAARLALLAPRQVERKAGGLALHWRGLTDAARDALLGAALAQWPELETTYGLRTRRFAGGLELRQPGRDKGMVVRTLLAEQPSSTLAYFGDDDTDEDAFRVLADGAGLGVRVASDGLETAASTTIARADLDAVLRGWLDAARRAPAPPATPPDPDDEG